MACVFSKLGGSAGQGLIYGICPCEYQNHKNDSNGLV